MFENIQDTLESDSFNDKVRSSRLTKDRERCETRPLRSSVGTIRSETAGGKVKCGPMLHPHIAKVEVAGVMSTHLRWEKLGMMGPRTVCGPVFSGCVGTRPS